MREIKFRGKRVDNGEWVYGGIEQSKLVTLIYDMELPYCNQVPVIPETVGQFTGLKDKNGVEIFEGDIVQFHLEGRVHIVVYDPATFRLADINGDFTTSGYPDWSMCEVIGNIHDGGDE